MFEKGAGGEEFLLAALNRIAGSCVRFVLILGVMAQSACSPAFWEGMATGLQQQPLAGGGAAGTKLMLFGGSSHDTYLGCVSCNRYEADSVFNTYGLHGSRFGAQSIFNHYSDFGSRYSQYGACNPHATDPPVIVDQNGNVYGRLTMNRRHAQRTGNTGLLTWLAGVCGG